MARKDLGRRSDFGRRRSQHGRQIICPVGRGVRAEILQRTKTGVVARAQADGGLARAGHLSDLPRLSRRRPEGVAAGGFQFFGSFRIDGHAGHAHQRAVAAHAAKPSASSQRGACLRKLDRLQEALEIYSRASGYATLRTEADESFLRPETIPRPEGKDFDAADWQWAVSGRAE